MIYFLIKWVLLIWSIGLLASAWNLDFDDLNSWSKLLLWSPSSKFCRGPALTFFLYVYYFFYRIKKENFMHSRPSKNNNFSPIQRNSKKNLKDVLIPFKTWTHWAVLESPSRVKPFLFINIKHILPDMSFFFHFLKSSLFFWSISVQEALPPGLEGRSLEIGKNRKRWCFSQKAQFQGH